jgi:hypothetical protein
MLGLVCLAVCAFVTAPAYAANKQVIHFLVTSEGLKTKEVDIVEKRMGLPVGTKVKLIFEYADQTRSAHQFSLVSTKTELRSHRIAYEGPRTASIEFTVGDRGEEFYRLSCELPCIAMEALTDYVIFVDRSRTTG